MMAFSFFYCTVNVGQVWCLSPVISPRVFILCDHYTNFMSGCQWVF